MLDRSVAAVHLILWRALCQALKKEPHRHARSIPHMLEYWASLMSAMAQHQPDSPWLSLAALWFICLHHPVGKKLQSKESLRTSKLLAQLTPQFFRAYNVTFQALPVGSRSPRPDDGLALLHRWVQKQPAWQLDFRHAISSKTFQWHVWLGVAAIAGREWERKKGVSAACGCVVAADHAAWQGELEGVDTSSWDWPTALQDLIAALTFHYVVQPSETLTVNWMTILRKLREMEVRGAAEAVWREAVSAAAEAASAAAGTTTSSSTTGNGNASGGRKGGSSSSSSSSKDAIRAAGSSDASSSSSSSSGISSGEGGGSMFDTAGRAVAASAAFRGWSVSDMVDVSRGETPSNRRCSRDVKSSNNNSCGCGRCAYLSYIEDKNKGKATQAQDNASSSSSSTSKGGEGAVAAGLGERGGLEGEAVGEGGKPPMLEPPGVHWLLLKPAKESGVGGLPPGVAAGGLGAWHPLAMLLELLLLSWPTDAEQPGKRRQWPPQQQEQQDGGRMQVQLPSQQSPSQQEEQDGGRMQEAGEDASACQGKKQEVQIEQQQKRQVGREVRDGSDEQQQDQQAPATVALNNWLRMKQPKEEQGNKKKQLGEGSGLKTKDQQPQDGASEKQQQQQQSQEQQQTGKQEHSNSQQQEQQQQPLQQPFFEDNSTLAACWDGIVVLAAMLQQTPIDVRQQFMQERGTQLLQLLYRAMLEEEKFGGRGVTGRLRLLAGTLDLGFVDEAGAFQNVSEVGRAQSSAGQAKGAKGAAAAGGKADAGEAAGSSLVSAAAGGGEARPSSSSAAAGKPAPKAGAQKAKAAAAAAGSGELVKKSGSEQAGRSAAAAGPSEVATVTSLLATPELRFEADLARASMPGGEATAAGDADLMGHVVLGSWVQEVSAAQLVLLVLQSLLLKVPGENLINLEAVKGGRYMRIGAGELVVPWWCCCCYCRL